MQSLSCLAAVLPAAAILSLTSPAAAEFDPVPLVTSAQVTPTPVLSRFGGVFFAADVNHDGLPDVVAYYQNTGIYVFPNAGTKSFEQPLFSTPKRLTRLYQTDTFFTDVTLNAMRVADLDGDGYPDLLGAIGSTIVWLRNLTGENGGVITFDAAPRTLCDTLTDIRALYTADIDHNGTLDVISACDFGSEKFYIHANLMQPGGTGDATFATPVPMTGGGRYETNDSVVFEDIDGDGDIDMVATLARQDASQFILWAENQVTNVNGITSVTVLPALNTSAQLPGIQNANTAVLAAVQGEIWVRFFLDGGVVRTFRESALPTHAADFARLRALLGTPWTTSPDATLTRKLANAAAKATSLTTSGAVSFVEHQLYSGFLPGSTPWDSRFYSPEQFLIGDLDGDGDLDIYAGYGDSYGPFNGWFENRLNEAGVNAFAPFQEIKLGAYRGSARLCDIDHNGRLDLIYSTGFSSLYVYYDFTALRENVLHPTETVRKTTSTTYHGVMGLSDFLPTDLDGDGDLDVVTGIEDYYFNRLAVSQNLAVQDDRQNLFLLDSVDLVAPLPAYPDIPLIRAADLTGDGFPELSLSDTGTYRNQWNTAPVYAFVKDASLSTVPAPSAPDAAVLAAFDTWLAGHPPAPHKTLQTRLTADLDGDGDLDVLALEGELNTYWGLSWYENRSAPGTPDFRGPFGISTDVMDNSQLACTDYDGDGDIDVLATNITVRSGVEVQRVVAFENGSSPFDRMLTSLRKQAGPVHAWWDDPLFTASLGSSDSPTDWSASSMTSLSAGDLLSPTAMKRLMLWRDPTRPRQFYRLSFSRGQ